MGSPYVDWSTAEVHGERLTVEVAGDRPRGWKRSFESVATLLGGESGFTGASLRKAVISIDGAVPGREDELRFFLEAVVLQANADHQVAEEDDEDEQDAPEAHEEDPESEITDRFRGFAAEESP